MTGNISVQRVVRSGNYSGLPPTIRSQASRFLVISSMGFTLSSNIHTKTHCYLFHNIFTYCLCLCCNVVGCMDCSRGNNTKYNYHFVGWPERWFHGVSCILPVPGTVIVVVNVTLVIYVRYVLYLRQSK